MRRFMKNFRFNTSCNNTQEPQELQRCNCVWGYIVMSAVIISFKKTLSYEYWGKIVFQPVQICVAYPILVIAKMSEDTI